MDNQKIISYYKDALCRVFGESRNIYQADLDDLEVEVEQLGGVSYLAKIPPSDFEVLLVGGNMKLWRMGSLVYINTARCRPPEVTSDHLDRYIRRLGIDGRTSIDDESVYVKIEDKDYTRSGFVKLNKHNKVGTSDINTTKKHYAWHGVSTDVGYYNISTDLDTYKLVQGNKRTIGCTGCGSPMSSNLRLCPVCSQDHDKCQLCSGIMDKGDKKYCDKCDKIGKCVGCGKVHHAKVCWTCEGSRNITAYHSSIGRADLRNGSRHGIGLELEKVDSEVFDDVSTPELLETCGWVAEEDSSLSHWGFELISPILPLDIKAVKKSLDDLGDLLYADYDDSCGGHIHISDRKQSPHQLFYSIKGYLPLLYGLYPERVSNSYCEVLKVSSYLNRSGHDRAISVGSKTVEFRLFPATNKGKVLLNRVKLLKFIVDNPESDPEVVIQKLLDKRTSLHKLLTEFIKTDGYSLSDTMTELAERGLQIYAMRQGDIIRLDKGKVKRTTPIELIKDEQKEELLVLNSRIKDYYKRKRTRKFHGTKSWHYRKDKLTAKLLGKSKR